MEVDREAKEEVSEKRIREEEKEENDTLIVERRCVNSVSIEAFDIFSQGEELESCGNSWGDGMILVAYLTVVLGTGLVCLLCLL